MTDSERSFIEESIRPAKYKRMRRVLRKVGNVVALGCIFGSVAGVCFYSTGLYIGDKPQKNTEPEVSLKLSTDEPLPEATIVSGEQGASANEPGSAGYFADDTDVSGGEKNEITHYGTFYKNLFNYCQSFDSTLVNIAKTSKRMDYFENQEERTASFYGLVLQKKNGKMYILTQYDEIDEHYTYSIVLNENLNLPARVLGVDSITGLAVMTADISKVNRDIVDNIRVATIGSSHNIQIGDLVVAIGNPMGSAGSVGYGVVCGNPKVEYLQDRKLCVYNTCMQNVEHGNGVIMDITGEVVGIITHKFSGDETLCSFIGISDIKIIIEKLMNKEDYVGIGIVPMDIGRKYFENKDIDCGIYVSDMYANTSAMGSGIVVGDIITMIDGQKVNNVEEYMNILSGHKEDDSIYISIYCDYASKNKVKNVEVTLSKVQ